MYSRLETPFLEYSLVVYVNMFSDSICRDTKRKCLFGPSKRAPAKIISLLICVVVVATWERAVTAAYFVVLHVVVVSVGRITIDINANEQIFFLRLIILVFNKL